MSGSLNNKKQPRRAISNHVPILVSQARRRPATVRNTGLCICNISNFKLKVNGYPQGTKNMKTYILRIYLFRDKKIIR